MTRKRLLLIGILVLIFIVVPITVYLVQTVQNIRSRAEKTTTITMVPQTESLAPGEEKTFSLEVEPGTNLVSFVKLVINYDPALLEVSGNKFVNKSQMSFVEGPTYTNGQITATLSVGSDATKVIQQKTSLAEITFRVLNTAGVSDTQITFDRGPNQTQALSLGPNDTFTEDVLSSANGATISIGGGACIANQSSCEWSAVEGADSYHYKITDVDSSSVLDEGDISETKVTFTSEPGKTYKCEVNAKNDCGNTGDVGEGTATCPAETPTPTPTSSPTPTVTPTPTPTTTPGVTETPTPTLTPTPTSSPTPTPTGIPTPTVTPTPTDVITPTPTPTDVVTPTPTEVNTPTPTPESGFTPTPTLPATGNASTTLLVTFVGLVLMIVGIAVFVIL